MLVLRDAMGAGGDVMRPGTLAAVAVLLVLLAAVLAVAF